jgi:hypothetical protein
MTNCVIRKCLTEVSRFKQSKLQVKRTRHNSPQATIYGNVTLVLNSTQKRGRQNLAHSPGLGNLRDKR